MSSLSITQAGVVGISITQVDTGASISLGQTGAVGITLALPGSISGPQGPPGPAGPAGPQGPAGPAGVGSETFIFSQSSPAAVWTINHNLGQFPSVSVVDSAGTLVEGDVEYISANQIVLSFGAAFGGSAYLN